jgi:5-methyltetrahydrofolate--homocysteine methyltransferase
VTPTLAEPDATRERPAAPPDRFFAALERCPLALDAGMGTRLLARGLDLRRDDPCLWNLDRPEDVLAIHRLDAAAGARGLLTNTFGANRAGLARFGRREAMEAVNRAAVGLARLAAGGRGFVLGVIGPSTSNDSAAAGEQAEVLIDCGVDAILLETFRLDAALAALAEVRRARRGPSVPLMASLWRWPDGIEEAARRLVDSGAAVVGLNCRPGISGVAPIVRRIAAAVACPLLVKPGIDPGDPDDDATPAAFAAAVPGLIARNVRLIGGCCGTTDAHVAAIAAACDCNPHPDTDPAGGTTP